jgi:hypothetical protein
MTFSWDRVWKAALNVDSWKITAYLFLMFSVVVTIRIILSLSPLDLEPGAFFCLGIIALSIGRFFGIRNPVPAPELIIILAALVKTRFLSEHRVPAFDEFLLAFDRNFGSSGMTVGRMFYRAPFLARFFQALYFGELLAIPLLYLVLPMTVRRKFLGATLLLGVMIGPLYRLCPGAGPFYLLHGTFPWSIPDLSQPHTRIIDAALNAAPSGHFAWAILMFWFAKKYAGRSVQIAAGMFMISMCIATLGMGEHYIIDLIVAIPFTACVWALVHRQQRFAVISMVVVVVWLVALREGWALAIPPVLVWILTAMTIVPFMRPWVPAPAGSGFQERRLKRGTVSAIPNYIRSRK